MEKENTKKNKSSRKNNKLLDMKSAKLSHNEKVWLGIATLVLVVLIMILVIFLLNKEIFDNNRHFTIHKVYIDSQGKTNGYWNDPRKAETRAAELAREMEIEINKDNLFAQDLEEKREDILRGHPEMKDVKLIPVYPDHLQIQIVERLPFARLHRILDGEAKLIDEDGCIFSAKYYPQAASLPHIADDTNTEEFIMGKQVEGDGIKFLMQFVKLMKEKDLQFQIISARIIKDDSTDNYGLCIKAHLKKDNFECENIFLPYEKGYTPDKLRESCLSLKKYAAANNEIKHGNLSVSADTVTER